MYPSSTISACAGTSRSTVTPFTRSTDSPRRNPASMSSSMCFGSGALAEYAVIGSMPSATATGMRPFVASQSARPAALHRQQRQVDVVALQHDIVHGSAAHDVRARVGDRLQLLQAAHLVEQ